MEEVDFSNLSGIGKKKNLLECGRDVIFGS